MKKTIVVKHTGPGGDIRVRSDSETPAKDAANILARRMYGKRGTVCTLRLDSCGLTHSTWEAFIGCHPTPAECRKHGNGVPGHNVWIYV